MERVMSELAGFFAINKEIELHLILYGITRDIFYRVPDNITIHTPFFIFNNKLRLLYTIKTLHFLRKTIKSINPYRILSFGELWNSFVLLSLFGLRYPVFISDRCNPEKKFTLFHEFLRKILYPKAAGIIAQTEKARQVYDMKALNNNIKVIGNPIREISGGVEHIRENYVLMIGRLIESKHQDKLIELFLKIRADDWKLILVGYDHLQQKNFDRLERIIKENNAENRVMLEGRQENVDSYYRRSKIFAFTSSSEGFPNVIGEAMSSGIPAVSFDCVAGPSEMIKDNYNGFLVPLYDYKQFGEKLEQLMKDNKLRQRLGEQAKKDIKQFSVESIGSKYLSFLLDQTN
jgi:GalNAc-alpha-(1->4)-GalNAc-alpha-(1->3)-diNAcBac-PP-undecaprenol alpha-1,4-N-acetyl-D-galactosaminyltransferase